MINVGILKVKILNCKTYKYTTKIKIDVNFLKRKKLIQIKHIKFYHMPGIYFYDCTIKLIK